MSRQALHIKVPDCCFEEQKYTYEVVFGEFWGIAIDLQPYPGKHIEITRTKFDGILSLDASFFLRAHDCWLKPDSLPTFPLIEWNPLDDNIRANLAESSVPVLFGVKAYPKFLGILRDGKRYHINLDIFGSVFFMLSRYEELVCSERDNYNRFSAFSSSAFKGQFLERPLADEYLEILWEILTELWPDLRRKSVESKTFVTCDVDQPFDNSVRTLPILLKACAGDVFKRKSIVEMAKRVNRYIFNNLGVYDFDQNYSFDWYLDVCESAGLTVVFYFIPTSREPNNGRYEINEGRVINLIRKVVDRGHEIGVHGSFQTYKDKEKILFQKNILESTLRKAGISHKLRGNRQHYLRWDSKVTPEYLDSAGFEYDTTGGYADRSGFRFGTSREFSMWGWMSRKRLNLRQRPLIVMECSIISASYMGLGYSQDAVVLMKRLKERSLARGGNFSLLWHNSHLSNKEDRLMFEGIINQ